MTEPILVTEDLRKTFGAVRANDGVSIAIDAGTIHGIMGPNGSGKSTFFNTVTGFYRPDGGSISFQGEEIGGASPDAIARAGVGRTFQIAAPFEDLTVRENLLSVFTSGIIGGLRVSGAKRRRAAELLELLEITHIADETAGGISGGQEKLLELGRILMLEPEVVLLDEPTAGVNPALQQRLIRHLATLNDQGTTFVIIEHDMSVIADICDTVSVFDQGQVLVEGSFDEVTADARVREAYLGAAAPPDTEMDTLVGDAEDHRGPAAGGGTQALQATEVTTGYGSHEIVHGVSVESRPGVTCIFGPNGSGKSTLLKALAGVQPIWSGDLRLDGQSITRLSPHEVVNSGITMVPQDGGIFPNLTVEENLRIGAAVNPADSDDLLTGVYEQFPALAEKTAAKGGTLSGGQRMMLSFARAMVTDAEVYLLDEPSSGLAPSLVEEVFQLVTELVDAGAQVILVEQNVREALRIADYAYILAQGAIQFEGTPDELGDEDELIDLYLGL